MAGGLRRVPPPSSPPARQCVPPLSSPPAGAAGGGATGAGAAAGRLLRGRRRAASLAQVSHPLRMPSGVGAGNSNRSPSPLPAPPGHGVQCQERVDTEIEGLVIFAQPVPELTEREIENRTCSQSSSLLLHQQAFHKVVRSWASKKFMTGCHCGLVDEGLALFQRVVSVAGLLPTMEQCACIVDLLARAERFVEALEFISQMPMRPNAVVWGALLSASRMHDNVEFARIAFEHLVQVEPENAGNFVTMSNIYAKAGMVEAAKQVRTMIDNEELAKPSGQSCVEAV